ncbi:adenosylcobinamide-phosphate synthase CbiB [Jeotgalibacillus haloalkalitolerans]|uniref:Cobalamin biosynthesis protein CobD n=1 Tax=Jeotgalibacillus haloalkalitolerans TaxID=3104292 RepID=A0ABU5KJU4_9BACL|nr:adenosylcobinamide-phosphate synthase CbiB [Jeotgalibacillus sp. HH7-29]MDZ5711191.1 adenosylcobinamide-phosphate synthase CbiB [Jeotgalibacillus sp. HH7-29]
MITHAAAITLALCLDRLIGDPPAWPHPVRWIGSFIIWLERRLNKGRLRKLRGIVSVCSVLTITLLITALLVYGSNQVHWIAGFIVETLLITSALASKSLADAAQEVSVPLQKGYMKEARTKLSWIVGRDTEHLDESEIARGTIETVAENTSDGVTAPMFWALIFGAPGIWVYKAVNTGDSIVGYKNERYAVYGWASARLDDLANWIPARITALLMLMTKKPAHGRRSTLLKELPAQAKKHPSPNSGWGEAAVALLLHIKLGGTNTYQGVTSNRPVIGLSEEPLTVQHIEQTITIMHRTAWLFLACCWIGGTLFDLTFTWR